MALINLMDPISKGSKTNKEIVVHENVKKLGNYLYIDTEYEGIKKIVSEQGGYLVFLDYGRRYKQDKKTGALILKQDKSNKRVETEAEAKRLRREAEAIRNGESTYDGKPLQKKFIEAIDDFKASQRYMDLSDGYKVHGENYLKHAIEYFANMEPKSISITDMEGYYKFLLEHGNKLRNKEYKKHEYTNGLTLNSVAKHRTFLKKVWEFFLDSNKYGVKCNAAELAKLPKVEITIDGKTKKVDKVDYKAS